MNLIFSTVGPYPRDLTVSPTGCQSLRVTWSPRAATPPLTLIQYRVMYQATGGSKTNDFAPSGSSTHTITNLTPATNYSVTVDAQTQIGYGHYCCKRTPTTDNGKVVLDIIVSHMPTPIIVCMFQLCSCITMYSEYHSYNAVTL